MKLKQTFDKLANEYINCFAKKYFSFDDGSQTDGYWVANEPGGVLEIGDYYFDYDTIRYCVDNDIKYETVVEWYDYCLRVGMIDPNLATPNIKSWVAGCPTYNEKRIIKVGNPKIKNRSTKGRIKGMY